MSTPKIPAIPAPAPDAGERIAANAALLRLFKNEYRESPNRHSDSLFVHDYIEHVQESLDYQEREIDRLSKAAKYAGDKCLEYAQVIKLLAQPPPANAQEPCPLPWAIEETQATLWIGTPRRDGSKLNDIVCGIAINGLKPEALAKVRANAALIVRSVNATPPAPLAGTANAGEHSPLPWTVSPVSKRVIMSGDKRVGEVNAADAKFIVESLNAPAPSAAGPEDSALVAELRAALALGQVAWDVAYAHGIGYGLYSKSGKVMDATAMNNFGEALHRLKHSALLPPAPLPARTVGDVAGVVAGLTDIITDPGYCVNGVTKVRITDAIALLTALAGERDAALKEVERFTEIVKNVNGHRGRQDRTQIVPKDDAGRAAYWKARARQLEVELKDSGTALLDEEASRDAALAESLEQSRLLGMSGSREAALLARLAAVEAENGELAEALEKCESVKTGPFKTQSSVLHSVRVIASGSLARRAERLKGDAK